MYYPDGGAGGRPTEDEDDTDDSTGEILSNNDLSLDKEEVARDLLPDEGKEENVSQEKSTEDGFQRSGESSFGLGTHRLLRCKYPIAARKHKYCVLFCFILVWKKL